eukprot:CAMPEP_0194312790 /NCGR_PEP_ID=MMETSP0171-20130528/9734_1 /TAXON_ID=218684 /ORGANISM="Corethron pennatum, Strain L29A3" /LENGTH=74 /DNA_ID=CAMNT_0039067479 /DNA_START=176 /DNA_END=400 /DNA_ORIENTATION=+
MPVVEGAGEVVAAGLPAELVKIAENQKKMRQANDAAPGRNASHVNAPPQISHRKGPRARESGGANSRDMKDMNR